MRKENTKTMQLISTNRGWFAPLGPIAVEHDGHGLTVLLKEGEQRYGFRAFWKAHSLRWQVRWEMGGMLEGANLTDEELASALQLILDQARELGGTQPEPTPAPDHLGEQAAAIFERIKKVQDVITALRKDAVDASSALPVGHHDRRALVRLAERLAVVTAELGSTYYGF